jgi:hypothetical protein
MDQKKENEYNTIEVSGVTLYYSLDCEPYTGAEWTDFYTLEGFVDETKWSWRKFKMIPTGNKLPNYVNRFSLPYYITKSNHLTKEELRKKLERKVELFNRAQELERGDFI